MTLSPSGQTGLFGQIGRFGLVGILVVALDYAVFAALLWAAPESHLVANVAGKVAGAISGFVLHRRFTFKGTQRDGARQQAFSYALLFAFNLCMSTGLLWLLVDFFGLNIYWSRLFVDGLVVVTSFTGSRLWVYRTA
jgi:putative flippase GtrA